MVKLRFCRQLGGSPDQQVKTNWAGDPTSARVVVPPRDKSTRLPDIPLSSGEYVLERLPKDDKIRFIIRFGLLEELIEQLLDNRIDYAIVTQKIAKPELEYQPIFAESFWLVGSSKITIPIDLDAIDIDLNELEQWLRSQPLIAYGEDLPIVRRFWRVVFDRRLDLAPQSIVPDLCAIRSAIAQGFGYSILPDYLCTAWIADRRLKLILKPKQAVTNQIWLVYRKSERQSLAVALLLNWLTRSPQIPDPAKINPTPSSRV